MELIVILSFGVVLGLSASRLSRLAGPFAKWMVNCATSGLSEPLRRRVIAEYYSEIDDPLSSTLTRLHVACCCFFDALTLRRLWRSGRLIHLSLNEANAPPPAPERSLSRAALSARNADQHPRRARWSAVLGGGVLRWLLAKRSVAYRSPQGCAQRIG